MRIRRALRTRNGCLWNGSSTTASGDLASALAGDSAKPEKIAQTAHLYGLDRPLSIQYFDWAGRALTGDLGRSLFSNEPVALMIGERIGVTIQLSLMSLVFALAIAIPLGVLAATRPNSWLDRLALDQPGVAVRGLFARRSPIDEHDVVPAQLKLERRARADHAGAQNEDVLCHGWRGYVLAACVPTASRRLAGSRRTARRSSRPPTSARPR